MYLAEAAAQPTTIFSGFDPFIILFTIIIAIGVVRLAKAPNKNLFAIGFSAVSLIVFLVMDVVMVLGWMGKL
ncbi:DUF2759 family protein [Paenibacillus xerothermodurans]|uniref:DUF2759 domain-containing protein n=1 Tax=Paenibacillus xerothermodurans TaxID=1977292 RepID=A0A2W1N3G2_PAEXE|nr:hypothetical protein [Paenibacillus xerothermodurans]PZE19259.1 hypothetical protein CBW46_019430 [Paenibacillus xerothermodurans]